MVNISKKYNLSFIMLWIITILFTSHLLLHIRDKYLNQSYLMIGIVTETYGGIGIENIQKILDKSQIDGFVTKGKLYLIENGYERSGKKLLVENINKEFTGIIVVLLFSGVLYFLYYKLNFNKMYQKIRIITKWVEHMDETGGSFELYFDNLHLDHLMEKLKQKSIHIRQKISSLQLEKEETYNFLENISHQLKTPLSSIRLYTEHLYMQEEQEKKRNKLVKCLFQVDRMTNLIQDLLKLGMIESGKVKLNIQGHYIIQTMDEIIYSISSLLEDKGMNVLYSGDESLVMEYDEKWMKESLINILKNCVEHSQYGTMIKIQYSKERHNYRINITDQGNGIKESELEKIFQRFYTGETQSKENSGIGLSLSKQVIVNHYGKIWVKNNDGKGVTFVILLPILSGKEAYNPYRESDH